MKPNAKNGEAGVLKTRGGLTMGDSFQRLICIGAVLFLGACGASSPDTSKNLNSGDGTPGSGMGSDSHGDEDDRDEGLTEDGGTISGSKTIGDRDGGVISRIRPALAVRGSGCIFCHGRVEANVITDFGFGSSYYFGRGTGLTELSGSIYGDHAPNWNTTKIWGNIVVPRAPLQLAGFASVFSLAQYLRGAVQPPDATTPAPAVLEQTSVYIGAPTKARVLQIAGTFPIEHPKWKYLPSVGTTMDGLELASSGAYVRNRSDQIFECKGDVVVNSILFLDHVRVRTDNGGCRLYVTQSVFIQGAISYEGSSPYRNLQITSAKAVLMGVGWGPIHSGGSIISDHSLKFRFQQFWTQPGFVTRDQSASTQEKLDSIVNDSLLVPGLVDAASQPEGRVVTFERLLVNAPNYQSRYQGEFKGVIISEFALASLGAFAFKFDTVFLHTAVLPRIGEGEILRVVP